MEMRDGNVMGEEAMDVQKNALPSLKYLDLNYSNLKTFTGLDSHQFVAFEESLNSEPSSHEQSEENLTGVERVPKTKN